MFFIRALFRKAFKRTKALEIKPLKGVFMERGTKFYFLTLIIAILLTYPIYAESTPEEGYQWLIARGNNGSYGTIFETAIATLALDAAGWDTTKEINFLMSNRNANQFCWPKTSCTVKDTSIVLKALFEHGDNIDEGLAWLENAKSATELNGNWYLQIKTDGSSICKIDYTKNNETTRNVQLVNGRFTQCQNSTWLNLKTCFDSTLIRNFPNPEFKVQCNELDNAIISLIFNRGSDYYLLANEQGRQADVDIRNECFGLNFKSPCNYESSLYASWILKDGKDRNIPFYLEREYNKANNFHNAFLGLIQGSDPYIAELINRQGSRGSWDFNEFNTALAVLAIKDTQYQDNIEKAQEWLLKEQLNDGSWNNNIIDTAIVLYSAFADTVILDDIGENPPCRRGYGLCADGLCRLDCSGNLTNCNNNNVCNVGEGCTCLDCARQQDSCSSGLFCDPSFGICDVPTDVCGQGLILCEDGICRTSCLEVCNLDDTCDINEGEDFENCEEDCSCGDNICDDREDYLDSCEVDCGDTSTDSCGDGICQDFEKKENVCEIDCEISEDVDALCSNGKIDAKTFEEGLDCGGACPEECPEASCVVNQQCEVEYYEDSDNCSEDCSCGEGVCDGYENSQGTCQQDCGEVSAGAECGDLICEGDETSTCPDDCEEKPIVPPERGFPWVVVIIIFVLIGAGIFVYFKYYKKPKRPKFDLFGRSNDRTTKPEYKAFGGEKRELKTPMITADKKEPARTSAIERELEKSIEEAKKLIKGK